MRDSVFDQLNSLLRRIIYCGEKIGSERMLFKNAAFFDKFDKKDSFYHPIHDL